MSFNEGECRRANSFYSIGGLLCHNRELIQTNCENGTTIFAVNINGDQRTDKRDIFYVADSDALYEDMYKTRMDGNENIEQVEDEDSDLYGNYAYGEASGRDKGQCLFYSSKVEEDGEYELAVRALEPIYLQVGRRVCLVAIIF